MEAPARQIDSRLLVAGLAAQAIARETERIAALESDIRERGVLQPATESRSIHAPPRIGVESYSLEQARLKWDEDRRRVESETLKADEEKRKAATPEPLRQSLRAMRRRRTIPCMQRLRFQRPSNRPACAASAATGRSRRGRPLLNCVSNRKTRIAEERLAARDRRRSRRRAR